MKYRHAEHSDLDSLSGLLEELFSIEKDFSIDRNKQIKGLTLLLDSPDNSAIFVAEHKDSGVIGMCTAQLLISTAQGSMTGLIEDMVVTKSFRQQKIGSKLLEATEKWCLEKGASRVQLLADKTNSPALKFYEQHQWQSTLMICLRKYL